MAESFLFDFVGIIFLSIVKQGMEVVCADGQFKKHGASSILALRCLTSSAALHELAQLGPVP
eukprot:5933356-Prorocentrum_lima.AAC.1